MWPGSLPRLHSTHQGVSVLHSLGLLERCKVDQHVSWLMGLQQSDGSFKDPLSNRPALENTFLAVDTLRVLGVS